MTGVIPALVMSTLAGLSTSIGGLIAVFARRTGTRMLSFALGLSAGVMVTVSFVELLPEARHSLSGALGASAGGAAAAASLLGGFAVAMLIDRLIPDPSGAHGPSDASPRTQGQSLARMGLVTALAMTLHNFPEGIATFMAGYSNFRLGLPVTISISLHNIPEGIAVSMPIFYGTGSRKRALGISTLSGLSEPLGALLAFLILAPFLSSALLGVIFGAVAGIMIYLSFQELIPASEGYGHLELALLGIAGGSAVMLAAIKLF
ncbi:MAG: zinc transporter ZupT [Clostridia bacterium]|nr:zinc transporter ZupT [Clostridia bacterium]